MKMADHYIDSVLEEVQRLLWGGSETENIEAHNIIAKLIKDRMSVIETREAITKRVWTSAPTPTGLDTIEDVRQMRSEDNETSESNFIRRSKAAETVARDEGKNE